MKLLFEWFCFVVFNVVCWFILLNLYKWMPHDDTIWIQMFALFNFAMCAFGYALIAITWLFGE